MRVLMFLSNPFTHDPRVYNEARSLFNAGHEVTVIAWDRNKQYPLEEEKDGIAISRIRNTKFMDLLPYDILRLKYWYKEAYKKALELHKKKPFDIAHCHDLDTLPIGVMLKEKHGLSLIYDSHEVWGYMIARDIPQWWANRFLKMEKRLAPKANHVITVAEPHKKYFKKMKCNNVTLVRNCKEQYFPEYKAPNNDVFTLVYIGGLNETRFINEAAEVCRKLNGVKFRIAGFGKLENELEELSDRSGKIDFLGKIPMDDVLSETSKGDVVLCMFNPSNLNNKIGPPNKIFEAIAVGRPVIAARGTYSGHLVEKLKMGNAIEFDKKSFKKTIVRLRDNPQLVEEFGRNALKAASGEFNWATQEIKLFNIYKNVETA